MAPGDASPHEHWLLLIYRVPQDPSGRRTYVWRQLKQLGSIYLQQAAAILPDRPAVRGPLFDLAAWIRNVEGEASLLETTSPDAAWERDLIARFNTARDDEYAELMENVERLEDELARESRRGKFTFAELEDNESDWEKLERWMARIKARDFFTTPGQAAAHAAMGRGRGALNIFAEAVYAAQGVERETSGE